MSSMRLTPAKLDRSIERFMSKVAEKADTNNTERLYGAEVEKFSGRGKAILEKLYRYAGHVEAGSSIRDTVVEFSTFRRALQKLNNALEKIADKKGDKDGILEGTKAELGAASETAASWARWVHSNVK